MKFQFKRLLIHLNKLVNGVELSTAGVIHGILGGDKYVELLTEYGQSDIFLLCQSFKGVGREFALAELFFGNGYYLAAFGLIDALNKVKLLERVGVAAVRLDFRFHGLRSGLYRGCDGVIVKYAKSLECFDIGSLCAVYSGSGGKGNFSR